MNEAVVILAYVSIVIYRVIDRYNLDITKADIIIITASVSEMYSSLDVAPVSSYPILNVKNESCLMIRAIQNEKDNVMKSIVKRSKRLLSLDIFTREFCKILYIYEYYLIIFFKSN